MLALAVLLLAVCSQVLADSGAPKFSGTFDGTSATVDASVTHSGSDGVTTELVNTFSYPTSAASWAGFANENNDLYPLQFSSGGGVITFDAMAPYGDVNVKFKFENKPWPDNSVSFETNKITVSGATSERYSVAFSGVVTSQTYESLLMYLTTRDKEVIITNIAVCQDTTVAAQCDSSNYVLPVEPPTYDVTFKVDMTGVDLGGQKPTLQGQFNGWCGDSCDNEMADDDGDNVWELTVQLVDGEHQYKYAIGDWADQETVPLRCIDTIVFDGYANRKVNVNGAAVEIEVRPYSGCASDTGSNTATAYCSATVKENTAEAIELTIKRDSLNEIAYDTVTVQAKSLTNEKLDLLSIGAQEGTPAGVSSAIIDNAGVATLTMSFNPFPASSSHAFEVLWSKTNQDGNSMLQTSIITLGYCDDPDPADWNANWNNLLIHDMDTFLSYKDTTAFLGGDTTTNSEYTKFSGKSTGTVQNINLVLGDSVEIEFDGSRETLEGDAYVVLDFYFANGDRVYAQIGHVYQDTTTEEVRLIEGGYEYRGRTIVKAELSNLGSAPIQVRSLRVRSKTSTPEVEGCMKPDDDQYTSTATLHDETKCTQPEPPPAVITTRACNYADLSDCYPTGSKNDGYPIGEVTLSDGEYDSDTCACDCKDGFTGSKCGTASCETVMQDVCGEGTKSITGTWSSGQNRYDQCTCNCNEHYISDDFCTTKRELCSDILDCKNGGAPIDLYRIDDNPDQCTQCVCSYGYSGPTCETPPKRSCDANDIVCVNGEVKGEASGEDTSECYCNCNEGYEGATCSDKKGCKDAAYAEYDYPGVWEMSCTHKKIVEDGEVNSEQWLFDDDFTLDNCVDTVGGAGQGCGNGEQQIYVHTTGTTGTTQITTDKSTMTITPKQYDGKPQWYSARYRTKGTSKTIQIGDRLCMDAKLSHAKGAWPALWFMGDVPDREWEWPDVGEIDMAEVGWAYVNRIDQSTDSSTFHYGMTDASEGLVQRSKTFYKTSGQSESDNLVFVGGSPLAHRYCIALYPERVVITRHRLLDDTIGGTPDPDHNLEVRFVEWPNKHYMHQKYFFLLNVAVGGTLGGDTRGLWDASYKATTVGNVVKQTNVDIAAQGGPLDCVSGESYEKGSGEHCQVLSGEFKQYCSCS